MLPTSEIRWFKKGPVPQHLNEYLSTCAIKERDDFYFVIPGLEDLGLKLREGNVEAKYRYHTLAVLPDNIKACNGYTEHWGKWSFRLDETDDNMKDILNRPHVWIKVKKARRFKKIEVTKDNKVQEVPEDSFINQGCNVEITEVTVFDEAWYTFCFEAFGQGKNTDNNLALVFEYVSGHLNLDFLDKSSSYGYPQWLQMVCRARNII